MIIKKSKTKKKKLNIALLILSLPMIVYLLLFHYLPMFGVVIAFKNFKYSTGIFGSPWAGFSNFKFFFESNDAYKVIANTVLYEIWFYIITTICSIVFALFLYEITSKRALKIYQTSVLLPSFISWVLVAYIGFALMSNEYGIFNQILNGLGLEGINWYSEPKYWPGILTFFSLWKNVGSKSIFFYAALMGIDSSLFEAAEIDGARRLKQIWHIALPELIGIVSIFSIMAIGQIMSGDFGLFYQVPRQSSALYSVTDILNTYIYRGMINGNISQTAAIGLFQSFVGMIMLLLTNGIIRKVSPENAMF